VSVRPVRIYGDPVLRERAVPLDKIEAVLDEAMGRVRRIIEKLCEQ